MDWRDSRGFAWATLDPPPVARHFRFRIANIPQSLDPEVLVAALATGDFKPYLVSAGRGTVVIAAPTAPPDIVFHICLHGHGEPPALPNLGNTCYATVALQCLPVGRV